MFKHPSILSIPSIPTDPSDSPETTNSFKSLITSSHIPAYRNRWNNSFLFYGFHAMILPSWDSAGVLASQNISGL
jgi:hypothetical protein